MITVTVAVLTYNPDKEKLFASLRSVLQQKGVSYEIVIADDGSKEKYFDTVKAFFKKHGFANYCIVENSENRGTVYNTTSAVEAAQGKYVKLLSPGDLLSGENILERWVCALEQSGAALSFADAVCYAPTENGPQLVITGANPSQISCYLRKDQRRGRYHYLIYRDLFLGAATMCLRQTLATYLQQICGKVVYAEDNIYRLMAYDRVPVCYFPETAIIYETGLGVSTSGNSIWKERLRNDWNACSKLLLERCSGADPIDKQLIFLLSNNRDDFMGKLWRHIRLPGLLFWKLKNKVFRRKTGNSLPIDFMNRVMQEPGKGETTYEC